VKSGWLQGSRVQGESVSIPSLTVFTADVGSVWNFAPGPDDVIVKLECSSLRNISTFSECSDFMERVIVGSTPFVSPVDFSWKSELVDASVVLDAKTAQVQPSASDNEVIVYGDVKLSTGTHKWIIKCENGSCVGGVIAVEIAEDGTTSCPNEGFQGGLAGEGAISAGEVLEGSEIEFVLDIADCTLRFTFVAGKNAGVAGEFPLPINKTWCPAAQVRRGSSVVARLASLEIPQLEVQVKAINRGVSLQRLLAGAGDAMGLSSTALLAQLPIGAEAFPEGRWAGVPVMELEESTVPKAVRFKGKIYMALDGTDPDEAAVATQSEYIEMPAGWQVAQDDAAMAEVVIGKHSWGTHVMVTANGNAYKTAAFPGVGAEAGKMWSNAKLSTDGSRHMPTSSSLRILIQKKK